MRINLIDSPKGPVIIGTVIGLFVLVFFTGIVEYIFRIISPSVPWKPPLEAQIRDLNRGIGRTNRHIEDLKNELDVQRGRIEIDRRLSDRKAELATLRPRLEALQAEGRSQEQELTTVLEDWKSHFDDYKKAQRKGMVGEKFDKLELAECGVSGPGEYTRFDDHKISVRHQTGSKGIAWQELPDDLRQRLDPPLPPALAELEGEPEPPEIPPDPVPPVQPNPLPALQLKLGQLEKPIGDKKQEIAKGREEIANAELKIKSNLERINNLMAEARKERRLHEEARRKGNISAHLAVAQRLEREAGKLRDLNKRLRAMKAWAEDKIRVLEDEIGDLENEIRDCEQELAETKEAITGFVNWE